MTNVIALSIKAKLLLLIFTLLLPYLLFNVYSYIHLEEQIEVNAMHYSEQIVQQLNSRLDTYFDDLERSALPVIIHPLVQELMEIVPEQKDYSYFHISDRINEEVIPQVVFDRPEIYGFMIVTDQGTKVGNFRGTQDGNFEIEHWENIPNHRFTVIGSHVLDSSPMVTFARKFWSTPSYEHSGLLVFELRLNHLTHHFTEVELGQSGLIQVIDESRRLLYQYPNHETGPWKHDHSIPQEELGSFIRSMDSGKRIVAFHRSDSTGLTVITEIPQENITAELDNVPYMSVWIHLTFIIAMAIGAIAFSFSLTRSVALLQRLMRKAEEGHLYVRAPEHRHDEIGRLNQSFNHMVGQIRHLIEVNHKAELREKERMIKEREAVLLAMQSQINPHFLYNTLEFINAYAIVQGVMPISRMATALGEMFRYSLHGQAKVTLHDEMEHVRAYLEIQLERNPHIKIEQIFDTYDLNHVQAIRLIVQPLVENALKHGYHKHGIKPDYIGIIGEACSDGYKITMIDRGKGMDTQQAERYNEMFRQTSGERTHQEPLPMIGLEKGIGLMNVHQRIRFTYGEPYGLSVARSGSEGTLIEMKLPYALPENGQGEGSKYVHHHDRGR